jgi:hypothetical protein
MSDLSSQSTRLLSDSAEVLIQSHSRIQISSTCEEWALGAIVGGDFGMSCREMRQSNVFGRISETMSVLSIVYRYGSSAILVDNVS